MRTIEHNNKKFLVVNGVPSLVSKYEMRDGFLTMTLLYEGIEFFRTVKFPSHTYGEPMRVGEMGLNDWIEHFDIYYPIEFEAEKETHSLTDTDILIPIIDITTLNK